MHKGRCLPKESLGSLLRKRSLQGAGLNVWLFLCVGFHFLGSETIFATFLPTTGSFPCMQERDFHHAQGQHARRKPALALKASFFALFLCLVDQPILKNRLPKALGERLSVR